MVSWKYYLSLGACALALLTSGCGSSPVIEQKPQAASLEDIASYKQEGAALLASGKPEDAIQPYDKWINAAPNDANAYNAKGVAFDQAGNHLAAQELYAYALKLSPNAAYIQNNLAMSHILDGKPDDAIKLLEPLAQAPDAKPKIRHNLALAYGMKGERDKALALGLKDLTQAQAEENLQFYKRYAKLQREQRTREDNESSPLTETPSQETPNAEVVLSTDKEVENKAEEHSQISPEE